MSELNELIASEIADFFAGFGGPGEPDIQNGEAQRLLTERVLSVLALRERAEPVAWTEKCEITNMKATGLYLRGFPDSSQGRDIPLYTAPPATVVSKIDRKAICNKAHWLCARSPGATFYNAAEFALDEVMELLAPPAPVVADETFDEWSRRCEIQLTLCRPEFREVAAITWNACLAAMLNGGK
ncbi:hypothetical protein QLY72_21970 [Cronobacter malonaticus]|uniref:hypothetical protein n=1 Tax=Cronobacter malonaticus TaxID=413503 RepID=UPI0024AF8E33|nr:hypothetical protein [Cronobacter malonaticus]MDI7595068.1 hypothetical protein [Cronobacter malonaticus]